MINKQIGTDHMQALHSSLQCEFGFLT